MVGVELVLVVKWLHSNHAWFFLDCHFISGSCDRFDPMKFPPVSVGRSEMVLIIFHFCKNLQQPHPEISEIHGIADRENIRSPRCLIGLLFFYYFLSSSALILTLPSCHGIVVRRPNRLGADNLRNGLTSSSKLQHYRWSIAYSSVCRSCMHYSNLLIANELILAFVVMWLFCIELWLEIAEFLKYAQHLHCLVYSATSV